MSSAEKKCLACGEAMTPIQVIDKEMALDKELEYTVAEAQRAFFGGKKRHSRLRRNGKVVIHVYLINCL